MHYAWLWLTLAILFEVGGTVSLKISYGLTKWLPTALTFLFYSISFTFLAFALKKLDISYAYAVWAAVGTALIALVGFLYFQESFTLFKLISLLLIIAGVAGLHLSSSH